jgi:hypothetical protein
VTARYHYVLFDPAAAERLESVLAENKDIFTDGVFYSDDEFAKTINLGRKLTEFAENRVVSVEAVLQGDSFSPEPNPTAGELDARYQEELHGKLVQDAQAVARRWFNYLSQGPTSRGAGAGPSTRRKPPKRSAELFRHGNAGSPWSRAARPRPPNGGRGRAPR